MHHSFFTHFVLPCPQFYHFPTLKSEKGCCCCCFYFGSQNLELFNEFSILVHTLVVLIYNYSVISLNKLHLHKDVSQISSFDVHFQSSAVFVLAPTCREPERISQYKYHKHWGINHTFLLKIFLKNRDATYL